LKFFIFKRVKPIFFLMWSTTFSVSEKKALYCAPHAASHVFASTFPLRHA
jgi:hypothetical protein